MSVFDRVYQFVERQIDNVKLDEDGSAYLAKEYSQHVKFTALPALMIVAFLVYFEANNVSQMNILLWAIPMAVAQIARFILSSKRVSDFNNANNKIGLQVVEYSALLLWVGYPLIFNSIESAQVAESAQVDFTWRCFLVYVVLTYCLDFLRYCKTSLFLFATIGCFVLFTEVHFSPVLDPQTQELMRTLVITGWGCLLLFGWSGHQLVCSSYRVIAENKQLITKLDELATKDELTKIHNRRYFNKALARHIDLYKRYQQQFSLVIMDIDYFKQVNDKYGHEVGDQALIKLALLLGKNVRNTDVLARYGGEEFALILPRLSSEGTVAVLDKLRESIADTVFHIDDLQLHLTVSMGVTMMSAEDDKKTIFSRTDSALYKAKENGRNRIELS